MSWKNEYYKIFKGRGKSWYKTDLDSEVGFIINEFLKEKENSGIDTKKYRKFTEEASFYWLCFLNVQGSPKDTVYMFEVRWAGSSISNRKEFITLTQDQFSKIECLNATPRKLGLEGNKVAIKKDSYKKKTKNVIYQNKKEEFIEDLETSDSKKTILKEEFVNENLIKPCRPIHEIKLPNKSDMPYFEEFLMLEGAI